MNIMIDEYGRPILLLADQDKKKRVKGLEAYKVKYLLKIVKISLLPDQWPHSCGYPSVQKAWTKSLFHKRLHNHYGKNSGRAFHCQTPCLTVQVPG